MSSPNPGRHDCFDTSFSSFCLLCSQPDALGAEEKFIIWRSELEWEAAIVYVEGWSLGVKHQGRSTAGKLSNVAGDQQHP